MDMSGVVADGLRAWVPQPWRRGVLARWVREVEVHGIVVVLRVAVNLG